MRRWSRLAPLALLLACSSLEEGAGGVVGLEIRTPSSLVLEVGETLQLSATALDADGNVVDAVVLWRTADAAVTVDEASGLVTAVAPGTGRVQATAGALSSELVSLTVLAPADTLMLLGDSVVVAAAEPGATPPLTVQLQSFNPPGPLDARPVIYEITRPTAVPVAVTLPGGVLIDTLTTATDGTVGAVVSRAPGTPVPDTVIVEVRASRTRGAAVPGSGQRFIVLFQ
ncbi:MAG TPA: Ig-like domain-containing protein [Gemmatimonadales bacterium]